MGAKLTAVASLVMKQFSKSYCLVAAVDDDGVFKA